MTGVMMTAALAAGIVLSPKGDADMTADVMDAVDRVRTAGGGGIRLTAGTYHFRSPQAMRFYVSNHDNPLPRNVFLPVTNVTDSSFRQKVARRSSSMARVWGLRSLTRGIRACAAWDSTTRGPPSAKSLSRKSKQTAVSSSRPIRRSSRLNLTTTGF